MKRALLYLFLLSLLAQSCVSVEAYQRMYLDDPDMSLEPRRAQRIEIDSETYREGAAGGTNSTAGGGCGCF